MCVRRSRKKKNNLKFCTQANSLSPNEFEIDTDVIWTAPWLKTKMRVIQRNYSGHHADFKFALGIY